MYALSASLDALSACNVEFWGGVHAMDMTMRVELTTTWLESDLGLITPLLYLYQALVHLSVCERILVDLDI